MGMIAILLYLEQRRSPWMLTKRILVNIMVILLGNGIGEAGIWYGLEKVFVGIR